MVEYFLVCLLIVWFALAITAQYTTLFHPKNKVLRLLRHYDIIGIIPTWTFFLGHDSEEYVVLYRDRLIDNSLTSWKEIVASNSTHPYQQLQGLWNPHKRVLATIRAASGEFMSTVDKQRDSRMLSMSYLRILSYLTTMQRSPLSLHVQFLIACRSTGIESVSQPLTIVFTSDFHELR